MSAAWRSPHPEPNLARVCKAGQANWSQPSNPQQRSTAAQYSLARQAFCSDRNPKPKSYPVARLTTYTQELTALRCLEFPCLAATSRQKINKLDLLTHHWLNRPTQNLHARTPKSQQLDALRQVSERTHHLRFRNPRRTKAHLDRVD